jgi:cystathionine gamma-lyase
MPPIYATSTYVQSSPGVHKGYEYSRTHNPTRDALQASLLNLEGGAAAFAFASGMAGSATILELLDAGAHIVAMHDLYGGSYRLFENVRKRSANLDVSFVDLSEWPRSRRCAPARADLVETPTNPLLKLVDLSAVAAVARRRGILSVCDNTFATPTCSHARARLRPRAALDPKFLNGHSDSIGGAAVVREGA